MGNNVVVDTTPAISAPAPAAKKETPPAADTSLPEKYRGKSPTDLVRMLQEQESELGRRANEIGTWRGLTEDLIATKRQADLASAGVTTKEPEPITSDALLQDPQGVISNIVERVVKDALKPVTERTAEVSRNLEHEQFQKDFPDYQTVGQSQEFISWVQKSNLRMADAQRAVHGDVTCARRLLEDFRDSNLAQREEPEQRETTTTEKPQGTEGARKSATEGSGGGGDVTPTGEILHQSEVVQLAIRDPDKYRSAAFQGKLMKAMKEGRYRKD